MRRSLKRLMTATGAVTEFVNDLSKLPEEAPSLIAVDLRSLERAEDEGPREGLPRGAAHRHRRRAGLRADGRGGAARRAARRVITYDEKFEPEDFIVTVTKLLHGQVFGLQKYFPWGVTLYNMEIAGYEEKVKALDVLNAYAELAGARGPVRDRMALVAEELMINAHVPRARRRERASRSISICRARRCRARSFDRGGEGGVRLERPALRGRGARRVRLARQRDGREVPVEGHAEVARRRSRRNRAPASAW